MVCGDSAGSVSFRWCNAAVHELASCRGGGVFSAALSPQILVSELLTLFDKPLRMTAT